MKRFLPALPPILTVGTAFILLKSDAINAFFWWLCLLLIGMLFLPLVQKVFSSFYDKGYLFSKTLGIAVAAYVVWFLSSLRLVPFSLLSILGTFIVSGVLIHLLFKGPKNLLVFFKNKSTRNIILYQETLFLLGIVLWSFLRGLKPELAGNGGLEKFMDYGYVNTLLRTQFMPPLDIWFAGKPINYYYFGHYITAFLTKLSGIPSAISYNLMMSTLFSFSFTLSFSLVSNLALFIKRISFRQAMMAGLISAALLSLGGNLHTIVYTAIYMPNKAAIQRMDPNIEVRDQYWFPDATRFIGHNPDTKPPKEDKTIHEFPVYSFLVSDLHAHVINLPFVLTILALMVSMLKKAYERLNRITSPLSFTKISDYYKAPIALEIYPEMILISFLIGLFQMTNYWDFPIYTVIGVGAYFYIHMLLNGTDLQIYSPYTLEGKIILTVALVVGIVTFAMAFPLYLIIACAAVAYVVLNILFTGYRAIAHAGVFGIFILVISTVISLPFSSKLTSMTNGIALTPTHSLFYQLLIIWGYQLFFTIVFFVFLLTRSGIQTDDTMDNKGGSSKSRKKSATLPVTNSRDAAIKNTVLKTMGIKASGSSGTGSKVLKQLTLSDRLKFIYLTQPEDILTILFLLCGVGLLIAPEIIFIKDIYVGGYYRSNTMFKLTYQAFVLFALSAGFVTMRIFSLKADTIKMTLLRFFTGCMICFAMLYPLYAVGGWYGQITLDRYHGLDGSVYLKTTFPDDFAAAQWLKTNEKGQPVVLEANGDSYTDNGRISVETGMPTIQGWLTHEWLWRNDFEVVNARVQDIKTVYESPDIEATKSLLLKYNVKYIVIGKLERDKFTAMNEQKLMGLGTVVFEQNTTKIILLK